MPQWRNSNADANNTIALESELHINEHGIYHLRHISHSDLSLCVQRRMGKNIRHLRCTHRRLCDKRKNGKQKHKHDRQDASDVYVSFSVTFIPVFEYINDKNICK